MGEVADFLAGLPPVRRAYLERTGLRTAGHEFTIGYCPEGHIHLLCSCSWRSEDHIEGERLGAIIVLAAEHTHPRPTPPRGHR